MSGGSEDGRGAADRGGFSEGGGGVSERGGTSGGGSEDGCGVEDGGDAAVDGGFADGAAAGVTNGGVDECVLRPLLFMALPSLGLEALVTLRVLRITTNKHVPGSGLVVEPGKV